MPPLYRRLPALLIDSHFYYKISRLKIMLIVVNKGLKLYKNYIKDPIEEFYNLII